MKAGLIVRNHLSRVLVACIIVNIVPVVLVNFGQSEGVQTPTAWIIAAFLAQAAILVASIRVRLIVVNARTGLFVLSSLILLAIGMRLIGSLDTGSLNALDFVGLVVRWLNIIYLFLVCTRLAIDEKALIKFMKWIVWIGVIACAYNLVFNFADIMNVSDLTNSYQANFKSFFANRNQFAIFLAMMIIASLYVLKSMEYKSRLYKLFFVIATVSLLLTFSRTAIAAVGLFLILVAHWELRTRFFKKYLALTASIVMVLILLSLPMVQNLVNTLIVREDSISDVSGRGEIWQMGLSLVPGRDIVFGVGEFSGLERAERNGFEFTQFHSFYVDSLVLGGVFWLLLMVGILLVVVMRVRKGMRYSKYYPMAYYGFVPFVILSAFESVGLFGIGYVDTIVTVFFVSIPLLYANYATERHIASPRKLSPTTKN